METTKLHMENVQLQIEKRKNDARVVQTHVDLKNMKWAGLYSPQRYSRRGFQNER